MYRYIFFSWRDSPLEGLGLFIHEVCFSRSHKRHTTVGRTPLDEWSVCLRDLYLTTHNTHKKHTYPRWDSNPRSQQASDRRPMQNIYIYIYKHTHTHKCLFKLLIKIHKPCYLRKVNTNRPVKHNTAVCNGFSHYTKLSIPPPIFATVFVKTIFQNTANTNHYTINTDYNSSRRYDLITSTVCPGNSLNLINWNDNIF